MPEREMRRVTLTLAMDAPLHKQVWQILVGIQKGKRTEYICKRIVEQEEKQKIARIVYDNMLRALNDYGGIQKNDVQAKTNEAGEIENNLFGFLSALEKEGEN